MDHPPTTLQQGLLRSAFLAALVGVATSSAAPPCAAGSLSWRHGEHRLELSLAARLRAEFWDAHATDGDWFTGLRTRLGARYSYGEHGTLFAELQDARVNRLDEDSSGAGALYRTHSGGGSHAHHDRIRQLWLELRPRPDFTLKLGRQDIKLGSEVLYSEPDWNYLKLKRLSERLVGTVGWTLAERSNDGAALTLDRNGHLLYAFAARPTTGVFDIDSAYASQEDILYGGISWTVKRGTWLDDGELRFFGLWYEDERELAPGGVAPGNDVEIWTLGFSLLCVRSLGPGKADLNKIALQLNQRPRKTLDFATPAECFNEAVALTG